MKAFMDENFLLTTPTAQTLFHQYAKALPIVDYHCHINPKDIAQDRIFENITQIWLGGDHYKWRLLRANGIDEHYITGDASDKDKFMVWAQTLPGAIGNPVYHWSHLELQRYFGYHGILNPTSAETVWALCNEKLSRPDLSVKNLIRQSNVEIICTTDDPIDSLIYHEQIAKDKLFHTRVLPAFRPDRAINIEKADYIEYLNKLALAAHTKITSFAHLKVALKNRMEFFAQNGCTVSDHALDYISYVPTAQEELEIIFQNRLENKTISRQDQLKFKTACMLFLGQEYSRLNWAMQIHYGCKRNNSDLGFEKLGPDTGYDCINNFAPLAQMADFLNALQSTGSLPRTILYSLNPNDNASIVSIAGCFQDHTSRTKIQHGSAWWFNDHKKGMEEQMTTLSSLGYLGSFVGMLTDSRSFLSYPRHEYFRRILCNLLGRWVEEGEYPLDMEALSALVQDIAYNNAMTYFKWT